MPSTVLAADAGTLAGRDATHVVGAERDGSGYALAAWISLAVLFLAWSVLPPLTMPNISLDAAEGLIWGRNWRLGYEKHPPLQAWLLELARMAFGRGPFAHVWLSAACACLAHIGVWRMARRVTDEATAFWASAALQTIYFHTYAIPEFNPNVLQLPFFAFAGLFAMHALQRGSARDWLALGVTLGAGMYAKYSVALIAFAIAAFLLADPAGRRRLLSPWPWAGALLGVLTFAPHLVWMTQAKGATVAYVLHRSQAADTFLGRIAHVAEYAGSLLLLALPLLTVLWLAGTRLRSVSIGAAAATTISPAVQSAGRRLVFWLALAPLAATAALALGAGFRIKSAWLAPLWCFAPLALMLALRVDVHARRWRRGAILIIVMSVLGLGGYLGTNLFRPYLAHKPMRIQFPGEKLAAAADKAWSGATTAPLRIVIGDTMPAGSVGHYSKFEPLVRVNDNEAATPWAPETSIQRDGALILWDASIQGDALPAEIARRRPTARVLAIADLPWRTGAKVPHARIGMAYLPPAKP